MTDVSGYLDLPYAQIAWHPQVILR